jgi:DNA-binding Lrp family transcriptional regulator
MADHCVFVFVKTASRTAEDVGNEIKDSIEEVRDIYSIMGDNDLLIKIVSKDIGFIQKVVNERIRGVQGVAATSTILGYQIYGENWIA